MDPGYGFHAGGGEVRTQNQESAYMDADSQIPRVLVVDDEPSSQDALKVILRPFCDLYVVKSAEDALAVLKDHSIDLVILELKLQDRSGLEVLQEIKRGCPGVEVILITGYGSLESAVDGLRHGATGYLLKPFNIAELVRLVQQRSNKKQKSSALP